MEVKKLYENGPALLFPKVFKDDRGYFYETFNENDFKEKVGDINFVQDNESMSSYGTIRGMHFQKGEHAQAKLVRCTKGKIYDVAVDIRPNSKTFGQYVKVELSEENKKMLYIPKGFAHGFVALSDVEIVYKTLGEYNADADSGIIWNDATINIDWEIDFNPILSEKDKVRPTLKEFFKL